MVIFEKQEILGTFVSKVLVVSQCWNYLSILSWL